MLYIIEPKHISSMFDFGGARSALYSNDSDAKSFNHSITRLLII